MDRIRPYLKRGESLAVSARQGMDGILGLLGFDPNLYAVFEIWDRETKNVVRGCEAVGIQGSRLCVRVPSTVHRQELMFSKERILARLNQAMGKRVITDIQFELSSSQGGTIREQNVRQRAGFRKENE
jgi:hypothetical protein